ncbi:MAG: thiamine diphosphokinase [Thermoanaerobacteraceae bacterium]|nr:thiamine diphosphokinase [Thermoanaerobacteraceae bacterium]
MQNKSMTVVTNGNLEAIAELKKTAARTAALVCVDGAADSLKKCGLIPDVLIGDFDSIEPETKEELEQHGVMLESYPPEKDFTDTELALKYCANHGAKTVYLFGALGSRLDHSLANILLCVKAKEWGLHLIIVTGTGRAQIVDKRLQLSGHKGDMLSLLPLSPAVHGVTLRGLKYPLDNATMKLGASLGVSNEFIEESAIIEVKSGYLLAIHTPKTTRQP